MIYLFWIENSAAESAREAVEAALPGKALRHHLYYFELLDRDGNPVLPSNGMSVVSIAGLDITGELRVFTYNKKRAVRRTGGLTTGRLPSISLNRRFMISLM